MYSSEKQQFEVGQRVRMTLKPNSDGSSGSSNGLAPVSGEEGTIVSVSSFGPVAALREMTTGIPTSPDDQVLNVRTDAGDLRVVAQDEAELVTAAVEEVAA